MATKAGATSKPSRQNGDSSRKVAKNIDVIKDERGHPVAVLFPERLVDDPLVVELFHEAKADRREEVLEDVLRLGSVAVLDDRIAAVLEDADGQIHRRFAQLKFLMDARRERWDKGTNKGAIGEEWVSVLLTKYASRNGWADEFVATGTAGGELAANKTGDIVATTERGKQIAIEVKFKGIPGGPLSDRDYAAQNIPESAWNQIVEAIANRGCDAGFIVFDRSNMNEAMRKEIPDLGYLEGAGLVCVVDWERNQADNLYAAYSVARCLVHLEGYARQPEIVASLISQAQAVVAKLQRLDTHLAKMKKGAMDLVKAADDLDLEIREHAEVLAAIGEQLKSERASGLTAVDQHQHYVGEDIRSLLETRRRELKAAQP